MTSKSENKNTNENLYTEYIEVKGAKVNNLKNISVNIKRDTLTVMTGLSGSGKSSLALDTLYAEGQRRYVESLSSYARQFLGRLNKPEVDFIKGIPPAIAVEQKVNTRNPRSTVGTSTEIYDYIKLLYARAGETFSPVSGKLVKQHNVSEVTDFLLSFKPGTKALIMSEIKLTNGRSYKQHLEILLKQGFSRVEFDEMPEKIDKILNNTKFKNPQKAFIIIDRISVSDDENTVSQIGESVETAFYEGHGECFIRINDEERNILEKFSNKFEADGLSFEIPSVNMFSFNNPLGACPVCEGYGKTMGIDENLVIPDKTLSVYQDAVACWKGEKMVWYKDEFIKNASQFNFPIHKPYFELTDDQKEILWYGKNAYEGLLNFFKMLESQTHKIQYRVMLSRYRGKTICPECKGTRLKKEASYVKVGGKSITELVNLPVSELKQFFDEIQLNQNQKEISKRILTEIKNRIDYLINTGLGYLTLNRLSSTLSGGESQRINLAGSIGSSLTGSLYILDEPSIGLHPRDTDMLIKVIKQLRDIGNTVVVVEHDEDMIKAADEIIDLGPLAGNLGGEIVFQGKFEQMNNLKNKNSYTAKYISGEIKIPTPEKRRKPSNFIEIKGALENNLKNINVKFPLNVMTVISGVSGSGKSTLVKNILYPALSRALNGFSEHSGQFSHLTGDINKIKAVEFIDQNPIGKSSRSNPVTYIKAFDDIRKLYASQKASEINGYTPSHFSFNVDGGRCDECKGEGEINIEMQFMADVHLVCEHCNGKRFKDEILDVKYQNKNIFDILEMTVDQAIEFFSKDKKTQKIAKQIQPLASVGLGYVKLGQSSNTLSGGESQRIKLATFLGKEKDDTSTLFIFDEPTTGLHFHDINKLLGSLNALIENGNTVIIIEHNLEVIKSADYIIDMGPEGGKNGGNIVFEGTPEELAKCKNSYTAKYLKEKLK